MAKFKSIDFLAIFARIKIVCLNPNQAWQEIKNEAGTTLDFCCRYFFIIFAIPALGMLLGGVFRAKLFQPLGMALIQFLSVLVGLVVVSFVAELVAPKFEGQTDRVSAAKLFGFSMIPGSVTGALNIFGSAIPVVLVQLAATLYGLKILWDGTPVLSTVPAKNRLKYLSAVIVIALVFWALAVTLISLLGLRPGAS